MYNGLIELYGLSKKWILLCFSREISFIPLLKIDNNVLANGIYLGELNRNIFKPAHSLYRANSLKNKYKHVYDLNDKEYEDFISGKELKINEKDNYYLL